MPGGSGAEDICGAEGITKVSLNGVRLFTRFRVGATPDVPLTHGKRGFVLPE